MKQFTLTIVAALLLSITGYSQVNNSKIKKQNAMETKTITQDILKVLENGWNNANGTAFAQPFADSSEFVDIRGSLTSKCNPSIFGRSAPGCIYEHLQRQQNIIQPCAGTDD